MRRLIPGLAVVAAALAVAAPAARADVTIEYFTLPAAAQGRDQRRWRSVARRARSTSARGDGFEPTPPIGRLEPGAGGAGDLERDHLASTTPDAPGCCAVDLPRLRRGRRSTTGSTGRAAINVVGPLAGDTVTQALDARPQPWGIAAAPDGGAWLTEYGSSNVVPGLHRATGSRSVGAGSGPGRVRRTSRMQTGGLRRRAATTPSRRGSRSRRTASRGSSRPRPATRATGSAPTGGASGYAEYRPCPTTALCSGVLSGTALNDVEVAGGRDTSGTRTRSRRRSGASSPATAAYGEFRLADMDSALGSGTPRGHPQGARRRTSGVGVGQRRLLPRRAPKRHPADRPGGSGPGGDDLQARRGTAAVRGRARARRRRLVHGLTRDRRRADRTADGGRRSWAGPDAHPDADPHADAHPDRHAADDRRP